MRILSNNEYNKLQADIEAKTKINNSLSLEVQVLTSRLEATKQILADTKKELVFYRELSSRERDRADRAVDNISNLSAQMPVSELGLQRVVKEAKLDEDILARQLREVAEIYSEVVESATSVDSTEMN
jgi:predicted  nucleic acid-binding Zn-ribbon protein